MRKTKLDCRSVDLSKYSDQQQRMISLALCMFEFTLEPARTLTSIAEKSEVVSERLWEIALERRRSPSP